MKKRLIIPLMLCLALSSCKKGIKDSTPPSDQKPTINQNCYISNWSSINGLTIKYGYGANNRIVSENIVAPDWYELPSLREFTYKSDRVTITESPSKISYDLMLTSNRVTRYIFTSDRYSTVAYNTDGYITKISDYSTLTNALLLTKEFKYTANNLTSIVATGAIGSPAQNVEKYTLDYYTDKKAIEGVDLGLNKFILPDWDLSDNFAPFQLPAGLFGKPSANLLKSVVYIPGKEEFNFIYDFDADGKATRITYQEKDSANGLNIVSIQYNCNK